MCMCMSLLYLFYLLRCFFSHQLSSSSYFFFCCCYAFLSHGGFMLSSRRDCFKTPAVHAWSDRGKKRATVRKILYLMVSGKDATGRKRKKGTSDKVQAQSTQARLAFIPLPLSTTWRCANAIWWQRHTGRFLPAILHRTPPTNEPRPALAGNGPIGAAKHRIAPPKWAELKH